MEKRLNKESNMKKIFLSLLLLIVVLSSGAIYSQRYATKDTTVTTASLARATAISLGSISTQVSHIAGDYYSQAYLDGVIGTMNDSIAALNHEIDNIWAYLGRYHYDLPYAPYNFIADGTSGDVEIIWSDSTNSLDSNVIYMKFTNPEISEVPSGGTRIGATTDTDTTFTYSGTNLPKNTTMWFWVKNWKGGFSNVSSVDTTFIYEAGGGGGTITYTRQLAGIDFEEGNLTDFTSVDSTNGSLWTVSTPVNIGTKSLRVGIDQGTAGYPVDGLKTFTSATYDTVSGGFFVYFPAIMNTAQTDVSFCDLFILGLYDGGNDLCYIGIKWDASHLVSRWALYMAAGSSLDTATTAENTNNPTTGAWYKVTWQYFGNQGSNGGVKVYVNNNLVLQKMGIVTTGFFPDLIHYGAVEGYSMVWAAAGYFYLDDAIVCDGIMTENFVGFPTAGGAVEGPYGHFVNAYATGGGTNTYDGTSWDKAWKTMQDVTWNAIVPGDTLYISGGNVNSSITYTGLVNIGRSGTPGHIITIRPGISFGHNGEVIFYGTSVSNKGFVKIEDQKYIRLEHITINFAPVNVSEGYALLVRGNSVGATKGIYLDSLTVTCASGDRYGGADTDNFLVKIDGSGGGVSTYVDSVYLMYSTLANTRYPATWVQADGIVLQYAQNIWILNNHVTINNDWPTAAYPTGNNAHNDCIASNAITKNLTIANNYMINLQTANHQSQGAILGNGSGYMLIYNNVFATPNFVNDGNWMPTTFVIYPGSASCEYSLYHNTIVAGSNFYGADFQDTSVVYHVRLKNNIFTAVGQGSAAPKIRFRQYLSSTGLNPIWANINDNIYGQYWAGSSNQLMVTADGYLTMANLNASPRFAELANTPANRWNVVNSNLFSDVTNYDYTLKTGAPAIGVGLDLGIDTDLLGNARDPNTPDIGAYEYMGASTPNIYTSVASLTDFGNVETGTNSSPQSYTVSGTDLLGNVTIDVPTGFQISLSSGSGYGTQLVLPPTGPTLPGTTIYARFSPVNSVPYSGNISHTSSGATTKNVSVSGTGVTTPPSGYPRSLLLADFEENNWSEFNRAFAYFAGAYVGNHDISTGLAYKHNGNYGMKLHLDTLSQTRIDTTAIEKTFSTGTGQDTISGYFYFYADNSINTSVPTNYSDIEIFGLYDGPYPSDWQIFLGLKTDGSNNFTRFLLEQMDSSDVFAEFSYNWGSSLTGAWHRIKWQYFGHQTSPNGGIKIWCDATLIFNRQTHATTGIYPKKVLWGLPELNGSLRISDSNSFIYFDDIIISAGLMGDFTGF
jgi:hypothetical protein